MPRSGVGAVLPIGLRRSVGLEHVNRLFALRCGKKLASGRQRMRRRDCFGMLSPRVRARPCRLARASTSSCRLRTSSVTIAGCMPSSFRLISSGGSRQARSTRREQGCGGAPRARRERTLAGARRRPGCSGPSPRRGVRGPRARRGCERLRQPARSSGSGMRARRAREQRHVKRAEPFSDLTDAVEGCVIAADEHLRQSRSCEHEPGHPADERLAAFRAV